MASFTWIKRIPYSNGRKRVQFSVWWFQGKLIITAFRNFLTLHFCYAFLLFLIDILDKIDIINLKYGYLPSNVSGVSIYLILYFVLSRN